VRPRRWRKPLLKRLKKQVIRKADGRDLILYRRA
jgi:hypothetical protein